MNIKTLYNKFSIIPLRGKIPLIKSWTKYQKEKIPYDKIKNHKGRIGIVCGYDNLEVIDIDNHFGDADKLLSFIEDNFDISEYPVIKTGSGGYHIYYKCDKIQGNQKLASRLNDADRPETLIETRGRGGQVVFYNNFLYNDLGSIKKIKQEERDTLLEICKSLNEVEKKTTTKIEKTTEKPGDQYNNDPFSIEKTKGLLQKHGWQEITAGYWRRPGKKSGISATFGRVGKNKFYVFSSNAHPFDCDESYTMFGVLSTLEHNGNYSECAKALNKKYNPEEPSKTKNRKPSNKLEQKVLDTTNKKWRTLSEILIEWDVNLRFNVISKVMDYRIGKQGGYEPLDLLMGDIIHEMEVHRNVNSISQNKLSEMLKNSVFCKLYNPVKEFFNKLPKYNGKDNIKELCKYIELDDTEDPEFFYKMLKKHFIRTVRCAKEKRYTNRIVLVLYGPQEIGKSEFFRWLSQPDLYYEEIIDPNDKDSVLALSKYMLINIDELDSLTRKDIAKLKSFISKGEITRRVPYGRYDEHFDRIASFVASTNKADILTDTINTRWIILKVHNFRWEEYIKKINPMQVWAEALHYYNKDQRAGDLSKDEKNLREQKNSLQYLQTNSERELLVKYFYKDKQATGLTATDIKHIIEKNLYPLKINFKSLVDELHRWCGEPTHKRIGDKQGRYYGIEPNFPEIYKENANYTSDNYYEPDDNQNDLPF